MSRILTLFVLCIAATAAQAQISVTPRGSNAVLDVGAWNVEFFGSTGPLPDRTPNDALQAERVKAVLRDAQVDLWSLEEVVSTAGFNALLDSLAADGYAGVIGPNVSSDPVFNQRLAFVYNTSIVAPVGSPRTVVPSFNFGGRAPLELTADVTIGGATQRMRFIAVHAKASSDTTSYNKRLAGAQQLKTYTDGLAAQGIAFVVMGDFNDELGASITRGRPSPYAAFVSDPTYTFATQRLDDQNIATYCSNSTCSSGSTLDHILIGGSATASYVATSGDRYGELIAGITQYTVTTSDHLPVLAQFTVTPVAGEGGPDAGALALLPAAPSPFRASTTLRFSLASAADVQIDVVDVLGRTVAHVGGFYGAGEHRIALDGSGLAAGLYQVRLRADGQQRVQTVVRAR